jgi:RNA polymerase sigma factor (sigma-70 family)
MPPSNYSDPLPVHRLSNGDHAATRQLVARFSPLLLPIIRRHLDSRVRQVIEAEDVMQEVWVSFFSLVRSSEFAPFGDPRELEILLCGMARNKAQAASRDQFRQKRDQRRNQSLEGMTRQQKEHLHDPRPGPPEQAVANDFLVSVTAGSASFEQTVLDLWRHRWTIREIAGHLDVSTGKVNRVRQQIVKRAQRLMG